jgi:hypothetical protein
MDCCNKKNIKEENNKKGILRGIFYGLLPHTFCIAFAVFTIIGTTAATAILKPLLMNRFFFYILIALSFVFASLSAAFYLKRNGILSREGVKRKWRYLIILYGTTIIVNLLFFMVIFPALANMKSNNLSPSLQTAQMEGSQSFLTLKVEVPCSGHAPLIIDELSKIDGIEKVKFRSPNLFDVTYNSNKTNKEIILSLEIFKTYKATII